MRPLIAATIVAIGLAFAGCDGDDHIHNTDSWTSLVACAFAAETLDTSPSPGPKPGPSPTGKCTNCNGTGRLGDGVVSVPCPVCGGDGRIDNELPPAEPVRSEPEPAPPEPVQVPPPPEPLQTEPEPTEQARAEPPCAADPPIGFAMVPLEDVLEFLRGEITPPTAQAPIVVAPPQPVIVQAVQPPPDPAPAPPKPDPPPAADPPPKPIEVPTSPEHAPTPDPPVTATPPKPAAVPYEAPPEDLVPQDQPAATRYNVARVICQTSGQQQLLVFADTAEQARAASKGLPTPLRVFAKDSGLQVQLGMGALETPYAALLFRSADGAVRLSPTDVLQLPDTAGRYQAWRDALLSPDRALVGANSTNLLRRGTMTLRRS